MHAHPIVIELYVLEDVLLGLVPRPIAPPFHQFPVYVKQAMNKVTRAI